MAADSTEAVEAVVEVEAEDVVVAEVAEAEVEEVKEDGA